MYHFIFAPCLSAPDHLSMSKIAADIMLVIGIQRLMTLPYNATAVFMFNAATTTPLLRLGTVDHKANGDSYVLLCHHPMSAISPVVYQ
jgi:hypothetical protein